MRFSIIICRTAIASVNHGMTGENTEVDERWARLILPMSSAV